MQVEPKQFPDKEGQLGASGQPPAADVDRRILEAVRSLDYGSVEVVVHDSRVVQIERREKLRIDRPARPDDRESRRTERPRRPIQSAAGAQ